jgi:hypothetical protein
MPPDRLKTEVNPWFASQTVAFDERPPDRQISR